MAFTKVVGAGIHTLSNITSHNIHSSGIVTATKFDGPFDNLNVTGVTTFAGSVSIGGTLTYEDVTNIDSIGIITARDSVILKHQASGKFAKLNTNAAGAAIIRSDPNNNAANSSVQFHVDGTEAGRFETDRDFTVGNPSASIGYGATISSTGNITAGIVTGTLFSGASQVGIQSGGVQIGAGVTQLNFIGLGNTFAVNGTTVDVSISGNSGAGGTWSSYTAGIATTKSVGVNTNNLDDNDLVGVGNSFQGLYISNGMMITDNKLNGNHYIGTAFNGLMAGPVTINGTLTIDGNYVVV